ncbi:hypothetical protein CIL05_07615 [Virgibacillus profundi]|uniref:Uncharacterized protein n=1 Tax=Virgibacillus profundi TaxID=2024555 RepID=A0A2A2IEZ9_9BACI|nr:hypothetical protein [Virgibacillus profundi]PAV30329.1 hypothetical protein CIL05_07615 [Virgibacillus profundi]PXY54501.1 hypothetical protein CIT14_07700 [Virgibacillus profundi]
MMIFFGLVLLITYLCLLTVGNIKLDGTDKETESMSTEEQIKLIIKMGVFVIGVFSILIIEALFLINALSIDMFLYPTVGMLVLAIIGWVRGVTTVKKHKKHPELKEYNKKKNRTVFGTIAQILKIAYFAYILFLLIF